MNHEVRLELTTSSRWQLWDGDFKLGGGERQGQTMVVMPVDVVVALCEAINRTRGAE